MTRFHLSWACLLIGLLLLAACGPGKVARQPDELLVAVLDDPVFYQPAPADGAPSGFEYDLLAAFAESQQRKLRVVPAANPGALLSLLKDGAVDFVAAAPTQQVPDLRYTKPLREARPLIVQHGDSLPVDDADAPGRPCHRGIARHHRGNRSQAGGDGPGHQHRAPPGRQRHRVARPGFRVPRRIGGHRLRPFRRRGELLSRSGGGTGTAGQGRLRLGISRRGRRLAGRGGCLHRRVAQGRPAGAAGRPLLRPHQAHQSDRRHPIHRGHAHPAAALSPARSNGPRRPDRHRLAPAGGAGLSGIEVGPAGHLVHRRARHDDADRGNRRPPGRRATASTPPKASAPARAIWPT